MKYVLGIILIGLGFLIVWKSDWIMNNFGRIPWAEEHLGMDGGTRLLWKLIGLLVIIGSFLYMTGALGSLVRLIFGGGSTGSIG
ncbi:MAG: hypothetical protein Q8P20_06720 [bacterium]|nr:hypothetical protein [bacterium]